MATFNCLLCDQLLFFPPSCRNERICYECCRPENWEYLFYSPNPPTHWWWTGAFDREFHRQA